MRADLSKGPVTFGALCAIAAYGQPVMRLKLKGSDLPALLEEQWRDEEVPTMLYLSGLRYERDGDRATDLTDDAGNPIDPGRTYTVAANELIATGDRFAVLRDRGRDRMRWGPTRASSATSTSTRARCAEGQPRATSRRPGARRAPRRRGA